VRPELSGLGLAEPVLAPGAHRLGELHAGEGGRPVGRAVPGAEVAVMQLDLHQPTGQQLGGGKEICPVQHAHRHLPPVVGQLPGHGTQRHRRAGQVGRVLGRPPVRILLDACLACLSAGVGRTVLPGPHADQHIPHPVCVPGQVGQDMPPGPSGEHRRNPQVRIGDSPRRIEQALRRLVDLVAQVT